MHMLVIFCGRPILGDRGADGVHEGVPGMTMLVEQMCDLRLLGRVLVYDNRREMDVRTSATDKIRLDYSANRILLVFNGWL